MQSRFGSQQSNPSAHGARGSLAKEGVYASSGKRRGSGSIHRDQQRQPLFASAPPPPPADVRSSSKASSNEGAGNATAYLKQSIFLPSLSYYAGLGYLLERDEWVPMNGGWYQISAASSGSFSKLGMHQIVENSCYSPDGAPYVALYIPRNDEIRDACLERSPYCDLEVGVKIIQSSEPHQGSSLSNSVFHKLRSDRDEENVTTSAVVPSMTIIFSMKSPEEYMFLAGEVQSQTWTLGYSCPDGVTILNQLVDKELKGNIFFAVLVQLRGSSLSVDINSVPVFTSVRLPHALSSFGGYPGVVARKGTRYAIKGWKMRGIIRPNGGLDSRNGNVLDAAMVQVENEEVEANDDDGRYGGLDESLVQEPTYIDDLVEREVETEGDGYGVSALLVENEEGERYYHSPLSGGGGEGDYQAQASRSPMPLSQYRDTEERGERERVRPPRKGMSLADLMQAKRTQRGTGTTTATAGSASDGDGGAAIAADVKRDPRYVGSGSAYTTPVATPFSTFSSSTGSGKAVPSAYSRVKAPAPAPVPAPAPAPAFASAVGQPVFKPRAQRRPTATATASRKGYAARVRYGDGGTGAMGGGQSNGNEEEPYTGDGALTLSSDPTGDRLADAARTLLNSHEKVVVETVMRDVVQHDLGVDFKDIAALKEAKRLLSEAVILPLMMPDFFTGIREPWKGVLLFGPPGTGKTLLAKAVCSLNQSSFFSCPSSSLVSKFRGESEKIVRCLFEAARLLAPSVVFLDEVDALVGSRGESGEHEASRRLKTEIFSQMDGIASSNKAASNSGGEEGGQHQGKQGHGRVMVLATTNCPWDLDEAIRRRLEKRIYIPLPDSEARADLFAICLQGIPLCKDVDIGHLASLGEGYSGADIHVVCREAAMMPMRKMLDRMEGDPGQLAAMLSPRDQHVAGSAGEEEEEGGKLVGLGSMASQEVTQSDFIQALKNTRPSVGSGASSKYQKWEREYGSK